MRYAKRGSAILGRIKIRGHLAPISAGYWNKASTATSEENNDPTDVWWDTENNLVPKDMEPEEVFDKIVAGLRTRGYMGPVTIRAVYAGFSEHITREFEAALKSQNILCTNMGYVDVRLAPKNAADGEIKTQIDAFVSENPAPRNIMIISGDRGFTKKLQDVKGKNYKTLAAFRIRVAAKDINAVVYDSWFWRMLLGLTETIPKNSKKRKREEKGVVNLSPAAYVNGSSLAKFIGQKVKTIVELVGSRDGLLIGKSSDSVDIFLKGTPDETVATTFVEVRGVAETKDTIRSEVWTSFGDRFVAENYDEVCAQAIAELESEEESEEGEDPVPKQPANRFDCLRR